MALVNPTPPPDGFYWFQPEDPKDKETIVRIYRSSTGNVYVSFPGTDYEPTYDEVSGMFTPVGPAPWAPRNIIYDGDRWERIPDERAKRLVKAGAITQCTGSCVAHCRAGSSPGDTMFHVITTWKHIEEIR